MMKCKNGAAQTRSVEGTSIRHFVSVVRVIIVVNFDVHTYRVMCEQRSERKVICMTKCQKPIVVLVSTYSLQFGK
jgi:hypothetical protein